jgi:hypothetical protein
MAAIDEDGEIDLGISLTTVATIVELARATQGSEEAGREEYEAEEASEGLSEEESEDVSDAALEAFIDELNEDEQAALIALAWIGRGDYEAEDWEEARALAAERNAGRDAGSYLGSMEMLGDLLSEGVAAFGLSLEEIER